MGLLPDEHLARRAARGDRRAFEAIYRRYHQPLYRFCLAMVGNPQDAQDALQNTMVKALRALPGEQRTIRLKPWLYRVARNESIDVLRRRRENSELDPELEATGRVAETAEARARLRDLLADLEQLPERQRAILVMRELSGLGFAEIGEALGTSAAVARQTLYEARLSLGQMEAGREMRCADVTRELSAADGRMIRRREIRAHLRRCAECRGFHEAIGRRRDELAAIAPLPLAASAGLLHGMLAAQAGAGVAGASGGAGAALATSTIVKSAATVAMAAVVGVSAADRGGLVDVPSPGGGSGGTPSETTGPPRAAGGDPPGAATTPPSRGAATADRPALATRRDPSEQADPRSSDRLSGTRETPDQHTDPDSAGASPPGGGHGSDSSARHGEPARLPAAAGHGQRTAASRRPAHAGSPSSPRGTAQRGGEGAGGGGGRPGPERPAPARVRPPAPPKPPAPPPHPLAPPPATKEAPSPPPQAGQDPVQESGSSPHGGGRP